LNRLVWKEVHPAAQLRRWFAADHLIVLLRAFVDAEPLCSGQRRCEIDIRVGGIVEAAGPAGAVVGVSQFD
jgi:hypothetical protein